MQSPEEDEEQDDEQQAESAGLEKANKAGGVRQAESVLNCLRRAIKIAHASRRTKRHLGYRVDRGHPVSLDAHFFQ